jgi:hypothetical protein
MPRAKKILVWILVAFAVYAIVTSPAKAADIVHSAWGITAEGATNLGHFFDALLQRS